MLTIQLRKCLCLLLCLSLFLSLLPADAFAHPSSTHLAQTALPDAKKSVPSERKEWTSKDDAYSQTFIEPNGKFSKEVYTDPVHVRKNGKWIAIADKLVERNQSDQLQTEATALDAQFPKHLTANKGIVYRQGQDYLSFAHITASDGLHTFTANDTSKISTENNRITYQNLFSDIDLRHVTMNHEVKEDWILRQYQGIYEFSYQIQTNLNAQLEKDGSVGFYTKAANQRKIFELPRPVMEDSNFNSGLGSGVRSTKLHYEIKEKSPGTYELRLIADPDWLSSPDRVYPVYIDPSVTLGVTGDTFVSSAYPTTNYEREWDPVQGEYVLKVGMYDSTTGTNDAYMTFNLGNLKGAVVDSATLNTYVTHSYYVSTQTGIWADRVTTGPWSASSMTWNNRPGSTNIASTTAARDQWAYFNVKSTVQGWINGTYPNYGFKLHENGNGQTYWKKVTASESPNQAKLAITYHYPTMTGPAVTATQNGPGLTTGYVNVTWPTAGGATSYDLQMFDGKGFETVYSGTGTSWTSKGKNLFPKAPYSSSSTYKLDGTGTDLAVDPSSFFSAKSGATTTRKDYGFRVIAKYAGGASPASAEVTKAIPANLVATPGRPVVRANAYSETDLTNKGRGWLDISWSAVPNAAGYKVLIYNGKTNEEYNVGNVTSWTTKGQNLWPMDSEIAAGGYTLHHDKLGAELPIDPNTVYQNAFAAGGDYNAYHRYSVQVKAYSALGTTAASDAQFGYIPLETPKNVTASGDLIDPVNNKGALTVTWSPVTGAGGYRVELYDGKTFHAYEVGKVTSWNSKGISLFSNVTDLPMDPTRQYQIIGAPQTLIDRKAYQVHVLAYRYNDQTAPANEAGKISGERGVSAASADQYGTIAKHEDLLGLENYFTYDKHQMGSAEGSVNVTTGNLVMQFKDQSLFTRSPIDFTLTRTYNSRSNRTSATGTGWTFAGNERLTKKDTSDTPAITYDDEDGTSHIFSYDTSKNAYVSPKGKYLTLSKETVNGTAGYRLKDTDGFSKLFEQDPNQATQFRLAIYQDANQNEIRFTYNTADQLIQIAEVDHSGNIVRNPIQLTYTGNLLTTVSFKDRSIDYQYTGSQLVQTTTHALGTSRTLTNHFNYDADGRMTT